MAAQHKAARPASDVIRDCDLTNKVAIVTEIAWKIGRALEDAMLSRLAKIVEEACKKPTNVWGYGIWTHHITRVAETAHRLAPHFHADAEIVEIAALLHDYASLTDPALYPEHHLHSPIEAEKILRSLDYPAERTHAVMDCIGAHRGSVPSARTSPEAECLASADAITHIEEVPSLLYLAFVQHRMGIDDGTAWVKAKLQRSWAKISPSLREAVRERYEAASAVLTPPERSTETL